MRMTGKLAALVTAGLVMAAAMPPTSADARNGRIAAGIIGGLAAGALVGAAVGGGYWGPYPYPYYYPAPVYYYPPAPYYFSYAPVYRACYRRTVWDGWRWRRVRMCY